MSINNIVDEPLKVKNWKQPNPLRIDYSLSIFEGGHWFQLGHEIDQYGNVRTIEKYNCSMP